MNAAAPLELLSAAVVPCTEGDVERVIGLEYDFKIFLPHLDGKTKVG